MPNKILPVEAYPAEYLAFLRSAALGRVEVPSTHSTDAAGLTNGGLDFKKAQGVVARLNALRTAMKNAKHPLYDAVAKASITFKRLSDLTTIIVGQPRDADILPLFHDAGFKPEELKNDPLADVSDEAGFIEVEDEQ